MLRDIRLAHDLARERFADLDVVTPNFSQVEHRIERRGFPYVRDLEIQELRQEIHARVIEPAAFPLYDK